MELMKRMRKDKKIIITIKITKELNMGHVMVGEIVKECKLLCRKDIRESSRLMIANLRSGVATIKEEH